MRVIWWFLGILTTAMSAVLDPALYLSPSPPLVPNSGREPLALWIQPIANKEAIKVSPKPQEQDLMEQAETLWPRSGFNFPIQFHLTGTYGGHGGTGVIGSSYASLTGNRIFGKPLAGSGYGSYGRPNMKIFGGNEGATWTGWGNGKWGHYGKGK
ncbi:unnamed protein product [Leptosia nina]|uniref:Uncharacterized protein n=1 Tax=Leptosia nina TaxID=320188 RepID=A0AAV1JUL0_9NEOP